jgi:hypothetical protein
MRDVMVSASMAAPDDNQVTDGNIPVSPVIPPPGSDAYIRWRIRLYLQSLLGSAASVRGILGGPRGSETWNAEVASHFDLSNVSEYNEGFVHAWLQTRCAAMWSRRCSAVAAVSRGVPVPELDEALTSDPLLPVAVDKVAAGLSGFREFVSAKAVEGISSLFSRLETELGRIETAIGKSIAAPPQQAELIASATRESESGNARQSVVNARKDEQAPTAEQISASSMRPSRSTPTVFPLEAVPAEAHSPTGRGGPADASFDRFGPSTSS